MYFGAPPPILNWSFVPWWILSIGLACSSMANLGFIYRRKRVWSLNVVILRGKGPSRLGTRIGMGFEVRSTRYEIQRVEDMRRTGGRGFVILSTRRNDLARYLGIQSTDYITVEYHEHSTRFMITTFRTLHFILPLPSMLLKDGKSRDHVRIIMSSSEINGCVPRHPVSSTSKLRGKHETKTFE
ncbi:predicted protein [Sclerotinia sclerotiorum 1980 UF-70]|uniref:Uncharacterized protein n=1 Tax=Sclerotinia sclerotiorum (strain ATCC 18683 / 1980 / Ss-1) TaxID=665079 RepID=A7E6W2_SCLS1|nr:predicted protein [Sclerotinia sclerotiorum 1980 UF-70]EDN91634.1 predicted protein [Sclerotinia sclerotiorum 1980 UF-70]